MDRITDWLWGGCVGLMAILWGWVDRRIGAVEKKVESKADAAKLEAIAKQVQDVRENSIVIREQMGRYNANLESEKRHREEVMRELRWMRESAIRYGRRQGDQQRDVNGD